MDKKTIENQSQHIPTLATKEVIDLLLNQYHQQLRLDFTELVPLYKKVCQVHGENHPELEQGFIIFSTMKNNLEIHLSKEEGVLFPLMLEFESGQAIIPHEAFNAPTQVLNQEHSTELELVAKLKKVTSDFRIPSDACGSYQHLYQRLAQMAHNLNEHIQIENNILFPRFQTKQKGGCCGMCGES